MPDAPLKLLVGLLAKPKLPPAPDTIVHRPVPVTGTLPPKVAGMPPVIQTVWSAPAVAIVAKVISPSTGTTHKCTHTYIHKYTHTLIHKHTYTHTHSHSYALTYIHTNTHTKCTDLKICRDKITYTSDTSANIFPLNQPLNSIHLIFVANFMPYKLIEIEKTLFHLIEFNFHTRKRVFRHIVQ